MLTALNIGKNLMKNRLNTCINKKFAFILLLEKLKK